MSTIAITNKILLVEDDETAQLVAQHVIQKVFCIDVDIVESGIDALRLITKNDYSLVFVDLGLLESDGFRITQAIRDRKDEKNLVPIIGISAFLDDTVKRLCFKIGMNEVFAKPLTEEICQMVKDKYL